MRPDHEPTTHRPTARDHESRSTTHDGTPTSEELLIRSYDHQWAYDLDVELVAADGDSTYRDRYYLLPGHTESETRPVPPGDYAVRVTLDNTTTRTLDCRLDGTPAHTAVIEVGNGAFSLTEGIYERA